MTDLTVKQVISAKKKNKFAINIYIFYFVSEEGSLALCT